MTMTGHEFVDQSSKDVLHWDDLWTQWQPVTVYGKDAQRRLSPFLPGDEQAWQKTIELLRQDVQVLDTESVKAFQNQLRNLPDIRNLQASLMPVSRANAGAFSVRELLLLKQFAFYGRRLSSDWASVLSGMSPVQKWVGLLQLFAKTDEPSFSVQHVASSHYEVYAKEFAQAQRSLSLALKSWRESWRAETGVAPDKDGLIRCTLPQQRALANQLKQHPEADWIQETPFEGIFRVQQSEAVKTYQNQQDEFRKRMDKETEKILSVLSAKLRQCADLWQEVVQQITEIDLRVSKVALWQSWNVASLPKVGLHPQAQHVSLAGAVHPVLAGRFQARGRPYVPLDWELPVGISVLSGSNMGGKTVAMSLLMLCQMCAQYGLPIPAQSFATRLFRRVRFYAGIQPKTRRHADVSLSSGLSSFGLEIAEIKDAWHCLETREPVLLCFDEPAKSTNPLEGEALVTGLLRTLQQRDFDAVVIVATHFPQAAAETGLVQFRVRGLRRAGLHHLARGSDVPLSERLQYLAAEMDYRVERVQTTQWSEEGLQVAAWIGLPAEILTESRRYRDLKGDV